MDFNTPLFLGFFAATTIINYILPQALRPCFLLVASYTFYMYNPSNRELVWILLGVTGITYAAGLLLGCLRSEHARRAVLAISFLCCIGLLFIFKYLGFFEQVCTDIAGLFGGSAQITGSDLIAPLGLSYFIFAGLSYVADVYRRKIPADQNLILYALFVSFFPCIFTGPIERYDHIRPQFAKPRRFSYSLCAGGAFRMLWGYFKKMVLADNLSVFVSLTFSNPDTSTGPQLVLAILLFSLQLYMDFSGCCDIAIGGAQILGFELLENFAAPFAAVTFSDFWRRWHMSLTGWFRDYLYIPLGGSHKGRLRHYFNLLIIFLVSGLWHGAAWGYVLWGLVSGIFSVAENIYHRVFPQKNGFSSRKLILWLRRIGTYLVFSLSLVFFMQALYNTDWSILCTALPVGWNTLLANPAAFTETLGDYGLGGSKLIILICGTFGVLAAEEQGRIDQWIRKQNWSIRWTIYYGLGSAILFFAAFGQSVFIYQQY